MEVASLLTFRTRPELFFKWLRPLAGQIYHAQPNSAHYALASLEGHGHLKAIITQNIDVLHQKAGSKRVIETHGTMATLSCTECFKKFPADSFLPPFLEYGNLPHCTICGGLLKPDVILFGEQLPQQAWFNAQQEVRQCDLMVVAGSSLEVLPVAGLPMQAIDHGAHLVIINNSSTYLNIRADIIIMEDVAQVLPAIEGQVR